MKTRVSVTKTHLIYVERDPFVVDSTYYAVFSSLLGCVLLGMACTVITVNMKTTRRDCASLQTLRTAAQTQGQQSNGEEEEREERERGKGRRGKREGKG
jgi:hypothetical protein